MADSDVSFSVKADTSEAQSNLDRLAEAWERVRNANGWNTGGNGGGGGNPPRPDRPEKDGEDFGKAAGKQIGRLIAAYMAREATGTLFRALRTPGQESPGLDMAQSITQGALTWGSMGAMVGQAFGPKGLAIAAGLGIIGGGVSGYANANLNERDKAYMRERQKLGLDLEDAGRARSLAAMKYMTAQGRLFDAAPGREARVEMIGKEADQLREMLQSVTGRIKGMIDSRVDQTSPGFVTATQERADLAARLQQLEAMKFRAGLQDPLAMASAGDYTDAFARRGLYVGAQVDVGNVNERIAAANEAQLEYLRRIADDMRNISAYVSSTPSSPYAIEQARKREIGRGNWFTEQVEAATTDSPSDRVIRGGYRGGAIWTH